MRLSDIGVAIELIQHREELGRVLFALEHGQGVVIATLDGNGVYVAAEKLPKKFENAIRALVEDVETQLKGYGVDPDTPLMPDPADRRARRPPSSHETRGQITNGRQSRTQNKKKGQASSSRGQEAQR